MTCADTDRRALDDALAYFRPHDLTGDAASILLTAGEARRHLAVIEAALRAGDAGEVREPPPGLLMSMAIRYDHGLGTPGYYDQPIIKAANHGISHRRRLESVLSTMAQLWEEVVGAGFYRPAKETEYVAMRDRILAPTPDTGGDHGR